MASAHIRFGLFVVLVLTVPSTLMATLGLSGVAAQFTRRSLPPARNAGRISAGTHSPITSTPSAIATRSAASDVAAWVGSLTSTSSRMLESTAARTAASRAVE
ncbi:MAG: hypothetical protein IT353_14155 [Gemmatimonadaceae bacterium]|nr:hypothetical protein [Gemmatimonadaceae bacterium]